MPICYCLWVKKYILAGLLFASIFLILFPYFTSDFLDLRQKQENVENQQRLLREQEAIKKAKKEAEEKIYLMGKFDPLVREDFALVPKEFNIGGYKMYLRKETLSAFEGMAKAAMKDGIELNITSATRNFDYQKEIWNNKWTGATLVDGKDLSKSVLDGRERFEKILEFSAVPGTSRHHFGTEIDINSVTPKFFETPEGEKVYAWLKVNAPLFGFCQTYNEKGSNRMSGYSEEKWHWSYLPISRTLTQDYPNLIKEEDIKGFLGDEYAAGENLIKNYVLSINPDCL